MLYHSLTRSFQRTTNTHTHIYIWFVNSSIDQVKRVCLLRWFGFTCSTHCTWLLVLSHTIPQLQCTAQYLIDSSVFVRTSTDENELVSESHLNPLSHAVSTFFFLVLIVFVNSTSFPFYGRNQKPFFFKVCVFLFIYCSNLLNCVINFILILSVMLWITVFVACTVHVQSEFSISSLVKLTRQNI